MAGDPRRTTPPDPRMFDAVFVPGTLQTVCMSYILYPTLVDTCEYPWNAVAALVDKVFYVSYTIVDSHVQNINAPLV